MNLAQWKKSIQKTSDDAFEARYDKKSKKSRTRIAIIEDFKVGTKLKLSEGFEFIIMRKYGPGIWESRGTEGQGEKVVYEGDARFYTVNI